MKKILICDDDEAILEALQIVIEQEGFVAEVLSEGKEVAKWSLENKPDLILLDMLLSGVNGQDVVKQLKKNVELKNIPVIMFSAHPSAARMAKDSGADAFVAKPFDIKELIRVINDNLKERE